MRFFPLLAVTFAALALTGCPNPNAIGVQTYGTVSVKTVDGSGQPVAGALVNAGSTYTCTTGSDGSCKTPLQLPVGKWTIVASAAGLHGSADVTVSETVPASVTIQMMP
jgi:hypothetical protein